MMGEVLVEKRPEPHPRDPVFHPGRAKGVHILRRGALGGVVDQAALEDRGMRRVDDREPFNPGITADRGGPRNGPAPVVPDQSEPLDVHRVGQCEHIGDQCFGDIIADILRLVARPEAAQIGHDQAKIAFQGRHQCPPGAVRFGKTVNQDHRRRIGRPGERDVHRDPGRKGEAALFDHG